VSSGPALSVTAERRADATVIRCVGEIDLDTAGLLREHVTDALIDGPSDLVVVLDEVTFIDSIGLGVLIGAHKKARVLQGSLTIVCTSRPVLTVFSATSLDRVFSIASTLDSALA
jgi:anti-sigma B factor antagonist